MIISIICETVSYCKVVSQGFYGEIQNFTAYFPLQGGKYLYIGFQPTFVYDH